LRAEGTERRKMTEAEGGTAERVDAGEDAGEDLEGGVMVWWARERDEARASSSVWYSTFSETRGS